MFITSFRLLPRETEETLIGIKMAENGGPYGYIDNTYPCGLFSSKELSEVSFDKVTIFYGGNGSGKSTLLNLIAERLGLERTAPFNSSEMFDLYAQHCSVSMADDEEGNRCRIPEGSRIMTSDDIFDYMLAVRANNDEITDSKDEAKEDWAKLRYGESVKFRGMEDYEALRAQILARRKSVSRRQFIRKTAGLEVKLNSNGETALNYFRTRLQDDTLYLLDEPENSMSPKMQLELVKMLEEMARYCGSQFIIATHSPFIMAMEGARVYDLDSYPAGIRNWWELENVKTYYEFFRKHNERFK
ncbi:MAG: AAA family ATPase [Firmicutes bacterium]|nr:AAA family ATPase [Bacillota bacterium]